MKEHLANFHIAGLTFYNAPECFQHLAIGTALRLVADHENKFDARAVALYFNDYKLGFIPRAENRLVYKLLKLGYEKAIECRIQQIDPTEHPEAQIRVVLHLVEAAATGTIK